MSFQCAHQPIISGWWILQHIEENLLIYAGQVQGIRHCKARILGLMLRTLRAFVSHIDLNRRRYRCINPALVRRTAQTHPQKQNPRRASQRGFVLRQGRGPDPKEDHPKREITSSWIP